MYLLFAALKSFTDVQDSSLSAEDVDSVNAESTEDFVFQAQDSVSASRLETLKQSCTDSGHSSQTGESSTVSPSEDIPHVAMASSDVLYIMTESVPGHVDLELAEGLGIKQKQQLIVVEHDVIGECQKAEPDSAGGKKADMKASVLSCNERQATEAKDGIRLGARTLQTTGAEEV